MAIPLWTTGFPAIIWLTITSYGVFSIQSGVFISAKNNIISTPNQIALTFDDGPHLHTSKILDLLNEYNAKATFFLIGENAEKYPDIVKRISSEGHSIGNHTYSHMNTFPIFSLESMVEDISKASIIIKKITGQQPQLFRPPFGITNPRIAKAVDKLGLETIGWNLRSLDTKINNPNKVVKRIKRQIKPGSVVLLHEYTQHCPNILEQILSHVSSKNYNFKTF